MLFVKRFARKAVNGPPALCWFTLAYVLLSAHVTTGQTPPDTDIFVVELSGSGSSIQVGKPINVTGRKGYDNQPSFTPDGREILYTSGREDGQTDIYRYDRRQRTTSPLSHTPESEYSPTVTPDGAFVSVIRVEADRTQRLWKFPLSGVSEPTLVLEQVKPVGYHCWLTPDSLALFILGKSNSLQLARVSTGDTVRMADNIGRSLHKVPGRNAVSFVHKRPATDWTINQLDLTTRQITTLAPCLSGSEDFVWMPDRTLLMAQGAALYRLNPAAQTGWTKVADFSQSGINQITRLAVDSTGKTVALVGQ